MQPDGGCSLCGRLRNVVERGASWTIAINRHQNLLGKSVVALDHHCERISELTTEKWIDLYAHISRATTALDDLFAPDAYNFVFLMNLDAHVHPQVVPRYASIREWRGETYGDPHYGSLFGTQERLATKEMLYALVDAMRGRL